MDLEKIEGLVKIIEDSSLNEFTYKDKDVKITMSKLDHPPVVAAGVPVAASAPVNTIVEKAEEGVKVLAKADGNIVAVKYKEQYGLAFHPELDEDDRIHEAFLNSVKKYAKKNSPNTWL